MFQKQGEVQLHEFPYLLHTDSLNTCLEMGTALEKHVCVKTGKREWIILCWEMGSL